MDSTTNTTAPVDVVHSKPTDAAAALQRIAVALEILAGVANSEDVHALDRLADRVAVLERAIGKAPSAEP
jgi:hypothetical protein